MAIPRKGCQAASSWAVHPRFLAKGLCHMVTWWHQRWDLMGKPVCALEAS